MFACVFVCLFVCLFVCVFNWLLGPPCVLIACLIGPVFECFVCRRVC